MMYNIYKISAQQLIKVVAAPGAQYILINQEEILHEVNAGIADLLNLEPVTSETSFNNFSVTKTATATAVMLLAEQGKLQLDDLVNPMFSEYDFKYTFTIRQLLSHQAGFADPIPISWIHLVKEDLSFDENLFIDSTIRRNMKQKLIPGEKFSYSSIGYLILSRIIQKVSGMPYEVYVKQNILSKNDKIGKLDYKIENENQHATGYHPRFSVTNLILGFFLERKKFIDYNYGTWTAFKNFYVNGKSYGGFIGNARGLSSYLQLFLKHNLFSDNETQKLMFTEAKGGMALGWFTGSLNGLNYICHAGGGGGYYCEIRIYPEQKLASVLLRNKSSFSDIRLLDKLDSLVISFN